MFQIVSKIPFDHFDYLKKIGNVIFLKFLFFCFDLNVRENIMFDIFWGDEIFIFFFGGGRGSLTPIFFA